VILENIARPIGKVAIALAWDLSVLLKKIGSCVFWANSIAYFCRLM